MMFILRKTPFNDLVRTIFEWIWFIPKEEPHLREKVVFVLF